MREPRKLQVKRVLKDTPMFKIVELVNGEKMVLVDEKGVMDSYAAIPLTQTLHQKVDQLVKANALHSIEGKLLHDALRSHRDQLFQQMLDS